MTEVVTAHSVIDRAVLDRGLELRAGFLGAVPFPHVVIDGFLSDAGRALVEDFPGPDWEGWNRYGDENQRRKMTCKDIEVIPPRLAAVLHELASPRVLAFLEQLTGIEKIIPDSHLEGGGLHCSGPSGILRPHTDFHQYNRLGLYRRLNLLVYLNPGWEDAWGGNLELYRKGQDDALASVVPEFGRCVIFQTDNDSVHGFPQPIADGHYRKSLAVYYYTAAEAPGFSGDMNTYWQRLPRRSGSGQARQTVFKGAMYASAALGRVAHFVDPNRKAT